MNLAIILGNLGRDPDIRSLPSGQPVGEFSVATSRKWTDRDGSRHEETDWHNVVVYGRLAEIAGQYLAKGRKVLVRGRMRTRSWDDKGTGRKVYRTEIVAEQFDMLSGRDEGAPKEQDYDGKGYEGDDDVPF